MVGHLAALLLYCKLKSQIFVRFLFSYFRIFEKSTKFNADKALTDTSKFVYGLNLLVSVSALSEFSPSVMPFKFNAV